MEELPNLEIYNSVFTTKFGEWALGFCGEVYDKENPGSSSNFHEAESSLRRITSLDLSNRSIHNLINKVLNIFSSISSSLRFFPFLFIYLKKKNMSCLLFSFFYISNARAWVSQWSSVLILVSHTFFLSFSFFQEFSPIQLPSLTHLNLRGNPLEQNSFVDLLNVLGEFPCLKSLEVILFEIFI